MNDQTSDSAYAPTGGLVAAPPPVAMPSLKSQEMVLVRRSEISTLKRGVKRCFESPAESAYAWASVWLGVGVAALFSLLALLGVKGNHVRTGILAAICASVVIGLFLAVFCAWFGRKNRKKQKMSHDDLLTDLNELSERAPTQIEEEAVQSACRGLSDSSSVASEAPSQVPLRVTVNL